MKIGMDSFRPQNTVQTEQTPSESPAVITTPKTSDALQFAQDKKLAENKKNEQAMFVSLQQAMLGAELIKTGGIAAPVVTPPAATPPPVGTETPEKIGSPVVSNDVLGPGSPPAQVKAFQVELNEWRAANGLPRIEANGIYSPETTQAVQDFQNATGLAADGMAGGNTKARLALENDPAFGSLKTIVKDEIRETMNKYQDNPAARDNLLNMATSDNFAYFSSTESQIWALGALRKAPADSANAAAVKDTVRDMAILENKELFRGLPKNVQSDFREAMYEHTKFPTGRSELTRLATNFQFSKLSEEQQSEMIKSLRDHPSDTAANHYVNILNSETYRSLEEPFKQQVVKIMIQNAAFPDRLEALDLLMHSKEFLEATPSEQLDMLREFRRTDPDLIL